MGKRRSRGLIRKEIYTIPEILDKTIMTGNGNKFNRKTISEMKVENVLVDFDGDLMNMTSQRYQMFKLMGTCCVKCKLEASFFAKERHFIRKEFNPDNIRFHFNLYGIKDGKEILFTKDHIIPKVKGGLDILENYQPMCQPCNQEKDDKIEIYEI